MRVNFLYIIIILFLLIFLSVSCPPLIDRDYPIGIYYDPNKASVYVLETKDYSFLFNNDENNFPLKFELIDNSRLIFISKKALKIYNKISNIIEKEIEIDLTNDLQLNKNQYQIYLMDSILLDNHLILNYFLFKYEGYNQVDRHNLFLKINLDDTTSKLLNLDFDSEFGINGGYNEIKKRVWFFGIMTDKSKDGLNEYDYDVSNDKLLFSNRKILHRSNFLDISDNYAWLSEYNSILVKRSIIGVNIDNEYVNDKEIIVNYLGTIDLYDLKYREAFLHLLIKRNSKIEIMKIQPL